MAQKPRRPARPSRKPKPKPAATASKASKPPARPAKAVAKGTSAKTRSAPSQKVVREEFDEETVCTIEFLQDNRSFIARLDTTRGGMREHRAPSFSDLLELVSEDLREEFLEI